MTTTRSFACLLTAVLSAGVLLSGCLLPVTLTEMLFPKSRVPAEFELPPGKSVLVFPDDMLRPLSYPPAKRALAETLNKLLTEKKLAAKVVPYDKLVKLRHDGPDFNNLAVATVGRRLGADLVIYIDIDEYSLRDMPVGMIWNGRFGGKVRVVDVGKGRLWPDESAGRPVRVTEPPTQNTSETYGVALSQKLSERLAEEVGGLFHSHLVDRHRPKEELRLDE